MFQPIQIAAIIGLRDCDYVVPEIVEVYRKRRDALIKGLNSAGWNVPAPKGTMFVWAKIPDHFAGIGSLEFAKLLIGKAGVAVSPGVGFGEQGDHYVRFALVENEQRIAQAVRGIKAFLQDEPDWVEAAGGQGMNRSPVNLLTRLWTERRLARWFATPCDSRSAAGRLAKIRGRR